MAGETLFCFLPVFQVFLSQVLCLVDGSGLPNTWPPCDLTPTQTTLAFGHLQIACALQAFSPRAMGFRALSQELRKHLPDMYSDILFLLSLELWCSLCAQTTLTSSGWLPGVVVGALCWDMKKQHRDRKQASLWQLETVGCLCQSPLHHCPHFHACQAASVAECLSSLLSLPSSSILGV